MGRLARALATAAVLVGWASADSRAQDSIPVRHLLALDLGRLAPFHRTYEMLVYTGDSAAVIGTRGVQFEAADLAGVSGWRLVEWRTGAVATAESLFIAPDVRPIRWSATVGPARLAVAFVGDTLMGATTVGAAKQNLLVAGRPDLLVSGAMVELVLGLLPLADQWRDSAAVLAIDPVRRVVIPVELTMLGTEELQMDSVTTRPAFVVALRSDQQSVLYWVDTESRAVLRVQQILPRHAGTLLEYRIRHAPVPAP